MTPNQKKVALERKIENRALWITGAGFCLQRTCDKGCIINASELERLASSAEQFARELKECVAELASLKKGLGYA